MEPGKFLRTKNELVSKFGGCTALTPAPGTWVDPIDGTKHNDVNAGFYVETDETQEVIDWLAQYKEILKIRFDQKEISMTYTKITMI